MAQKRRVTDSRERKPRTALDRATLDRLALGYVGRYATTRARLGRYLTRKLKQSGWAEPDEPPIADIVERLTALGFVDDRSFAEGRSAALVRRGYGARRVALALRGAGVEDEVAKAAGPDAAAAFDAALTYARRRRFGPFASVEPAPDQRRRQLAAMLRAGHSYDLAARIVSAQAGVVPEREE